MMLSWDRLLAVLASAARCLQGKPQPEVRNVPLDAAGKECGHNITCCLGLKKRLAELCPTQNFHYANVHGFTRPPAWVPCFYYFQKTFMLVNTSTKTG